jgi:hypothetical protein
MRGVSVDKVVHTACIHVFDSNRFDSNRSGKVLARQFPTLTCLSLPAIFQAIFDYANI